MTTQDTGLVEQCVRKIHEVDDEPFEDVSPLRAVTITLRAILPHLSPESQALLRKELNGE